MGGKEWDNIKDKELKTIKNPFPGIVFYQLT